MWILAAKLPNSDMILLWIFGFLFPRKKPQMIHKNPQNSPRNLWVKFVWKNSPQVSAEAFFFPSTPFRDFPVFRVFPIRAFLTVPRCLLVGGPTGNVLKGYWTRSRPFPTKMGNPPARGPSLAILWLLRTSLSIWSLCGKGHSSQSLEAAIELSDSNSSKCSQGCWNPLATPSLLSKRPF